MKTQMQTRYGKNEHTTYSILKILSVYGFVGFCVVNIVVTPLRAFMHFNKYTFEKVAREDGTHVVERVLLCLFINVTCP